MNENTKYRHELKYRCSETQIEIIRNRLHNILEFDSHALNGQYNIRSMYFDNYQNRCYYENENGTDCREKFRIRIYNANEDRITLECKRKQNGKTYKTSCQLSREEYDSILYGGNLTQLSAKPDLLKKFLILMKTQLFTPSVIVEYDRTPYIYPAGNVRITLDQNIRSSSNFAGFFDTNIASRPILPKGQHLLEVKYDEFLPSFIKEALQIDHLQRTTFSKFYLCKKYSNGGIL